MNVLVTNASSPKGLVVTRSLGRKGIEVTTTDHERFSPTFFSKYSKNHFLSPSPEISPIDFVNKILNTIKRSEIDVLMPVNSTETLLISKYKDKFTPYTKVPFADYQKMKLVNDKSEVMKIASELDIRIPETYNMDNTADLKKISKKLVYPVVIKMRTGTSSLGVSYAYSADEFISKYKQTIHKFNLAPSEYPVVQEYIAGTGFGVSMLFNHGDIRAIFTHKRLREYPITGGPSTLRISVRHPEMENAARKILEHVSWHGVAMVEFKLDESTNKPVLIEINPRFWGSIYQAVAAGVDFPYLLYEMAVKGDVKPVLDYKAGVKTRFLWNDFRSLFSHLKNSNGRFQTLKELLIFYEEKLYYDTISTDDIFPVIMFGYMGAKELLNSKYS